MNKKGRVFHVYSEGHTMTKKNYEKALDDLEQATKEFCEYLNTEDPRCLYGIANYLIDDVTELEKAKERIKKLIEERE